LVSANLALWFWWTLNTSSCHMASVLNCCFIAKLFCCRVSKDKYLLQHILKDGWLVPNFSKISSKHNFYHIEIYHVFF
jgi:hypothetical protein